MLTDLHDRARHGLADPGQTWPEAKGPPVIARARRDPGSWAVCLILDATTASTAIFAITAHADQREAHIREVEHFGQNLPEGSYGRRNRQAIADRETRIATRLRTIERAYRTATEHDTALNRPELTAAPSPPQQPADWEIELE
jgi:NaMN:DMB phosphoribosyltransferase